MRVAEHEDVSSIARGDELGGRPPELVAVADVNRHAAERDDALARERRIVRIVDVAIHRVGRRDRIQRRQHRRAAHVARVKNPRHAAEAIRDRRAQEAVGVRDEADGDQEI